jgi:hypothetical protein
MATIGAAHDAVNDTFLASSDAIGASMIDTASGITGCVKSFVYSIPSGC